MNFWLNNYCHYKIISTKPTKISASKINSAQINAALTVSGIWVVAPPPLLQDLFVKNIGILYTYDFQTFLLKFYCLKDFHRSSGPRKLSRDFLSTGGKRNFAIFEVFKAYLSEFSIYFHEICMVAKSYQVLAVYIKSLLLSALVSLERRLKVPILAIFDAFWHFSSWSLWHKPFDLGQ